MAKFELPDNINQAFVDGILSGYKQYLAQRRKAQIDLVVSTAFAWTKGNFIDSNIYDRCQSYDGIETSMRRQDMHGDICNSDFKILEKRF
ncbi:hypothetical protein [Lentilactobacillus otakiensis]|uniref:hypothetical protein n=1 Tax=Lentilactobacillus otakiensis TaxID=481720 RepID=UPI003D177889